MPKPKIARVSLQLSVTEDTKERLCDYAVERHSNMSQIITDWIWSVTLKSEREAAKKKNG